MNENQNWNDGQDWDLKPETNSIENEEVTEKESAEECVVEEPAAGSVEELVENPVEEPAAEHVPEEDATEEESVMQEQVSESSEYQYQDAPVTPITGQRHYTDYEFSEAEHTTGYTEQKSSGMFKKVMTTAALAAVFGIVAGGVMLGIQVIGHSLVASDVVTEQVKIEEADPAVAEIEEILEEKESQETVASSGSSYTVKEIAKNCMPSVVSITNASVTSVQDFFGGVQEYESESSGSGIIVGQNDTELLIATNNHVVEGAKTITVAFADGELYEAQTKGTDKSNDLAVVAVNLADLSESTKKAIKVIAIGDSDRLEVGEQVVAIGNALGYGQSVTSGWVSAVGREVTDEDGNTIKELIQTDAAINPGNSGGPLLNMQGELIGINSAKVGGSAIEGMGYAISISVAEPILGDLMNRETRYKVSEKEASYIGITCMNVDVTVAETYGIPVGAFVDSVESGGPAEKAGIQRGDVIIEFDGLVVSGSTDLVDKLQYYKAGEVVEVIISRAEGGSYQEQTVTVTLGRRSEMTQTVPES